ncbi:MAG: GxxExxY protein [Gemmatimonadaceae bacterium]
MARIQLIEEELTSSVIGAFYEVYNTLGFGFLEHVYIMSLERELLERGHRIGREVPVPVMYKRHQVAHQRLDMIVDEKLVVETKSTYQLPNAAQRQLYNYLKATNIDLGLLLHFGPDPKFYRLYCPKRPSDRSEESAASG